MRLGTKREKRERHSQFRIQNTKKKLNKSLKWETATPNTNENPFSYVA